MKVAPNMTPRDLSRIAGVGYDHPGCIGHQVFQLQDVRLIGWREVDGSEPVLVVDGSMELEPVMPALVVAAKGRYSSGDLVPVSPEDSAHWQHGAVGEAEWSCRGERGLQQLDQDREEAVTVSDEVLVLWQRREAVMVVAGNPGIHAAECLVRFGETVPDEDGEKFAIAQSTGTTDWFCLGI